MPRYLYSKGSITSAAPQAKPASGVHEYETRVRMAGITARRVDSIDAVDPNEWDSIVRERDVLNMHAYQTAIERSGVNDFRYRYLLFRREGKLVAHVSVGIFTFGLDVMLQDPLKSIFARIKRRFPRFLRITLIECGHPTALGTTFALADPGDMPEILPLFNKEMERLAREQKTSLLAVRDISDADQKLFAPLLRLGYRDTPNMANTLLHLPQKSWDQYLDDLVARRRREIKQRMKVFQSEGCTVEKIYDFAGCAEQIHALWVQTFKQATEYQREVLTVEYFRGMAEQLGKRAFILLCRKDDTPIGFTMLLDAGDTLISTYCGLDYEMNRSTYTYFVLFYQSIAEAISMGKEWLELGITNYNPKIEVGALPEPISIYARSLKPLGNLFFAPALRLMASPPHFNKRKIFNERYYERYAITEPLVATVAGGQHSVIEVSEAGLAVEGASPLARRRHALLLDIPGEQPLRMTVAARGAVRTGERWRTGLCIAGMPPASAPRWREIVRRCAGEA
jgi:predicted N-acyltransferase